MEIVKPRWSSSSFLVYAGALTVGSAASYALVYLSSQYGDAAYVAWSLLVLAGLLGLAVVARRHSRLAAGVFAFVAVGAFGGFVGALWKWFGWGIGGSPFGGFNVGRLGATLLILLFAVALIHRFRHPLLAYPVTFLAWFFATDLISGGGNWTAFVTAFTGFVLLLVGVTLDRGPRRPYGFWVHVVSGATLGGALLYWWHAGTWHWIFVAIGGLVFIRVAGATARSSWAVFGAIGLAAAATRFASVWSRSHVPVVGAFLPGQAGTPTSAEPRAWVPPLVCAALGFVFVALGFALSRRERRSPLPSGG
ncbi:MAG TPA: hypothetical protein VGU02_14750 [Gaiellaceae bacterium]|nr:hypothetical protein [Gaiellaceae bacterium]